MLISRDLNIGFMDFVAMETVQNGRLALWPSVALAARDRRAVTQVGGGRCNSEGDQLCKVGVWVHILG